MTDSFFTTQNRFDTQFATFDRITCNELLDAGTRRLIALDGVASTARRHYRLADICAGAHVVPLEAWAKAEKPPAASPPKPAKAQPGGWLLLYCCFMAGLAAGLWLGRHA